MPQVVTDIRYVRKYTAGKKLKKLKKIAHRAHRRANRHLVRQGKEPSSKPRLTDRDII